MNIQGLTKTKMIEVEEAVGPNTIMCLTETQRKVDDIGTKKNLKVLVSMRDMKDRKGGGLMVMYEEKERLYFEKKECRNADMMMLEGQVGAVRMRIIVVYLRTGNEVEVMEYNRKIMGEVEEKVQQVQDKEIGVLLLGDFNAHLGYVGHHQENRNGKAVNEMMERMDMILLNLEERCEGTYTWECGERKSVIDLVMVNGKAYEQFAGMKIDEDREEFDLSDHAMITVKLKMAHKVKKNGERGGWITTDYYDMDEKKMKVFRERVEEKLIAVAEMNIKTLNEVVKQQAEEVLKKQYKRKRREDGGKEKPWMNEEIRKAIKERKKYNREARNAKDEETKKSAREKYKEKRERAKELIRMAIGKQEEKIAKELREKRNGRYIWDNIRKLRGEEMRRQEQVAIYDKNGEKMEEREMEETIRYHWNGVLKKHPNRMTEKWTNEKKEQYEEMLKNCSKIEKKEEGKIQLPRVGEPYKKIKVMENGEITEEEVRKILKKIKNRKAGGVDGMKGEMYKELEKGKVAVQSICESFNKILQEGKEPDTWKMARMKMIPKKKRPEVDELRPLTMTDALYKVMMAVVREKIEGQIEKNGMRRLEQTGFTGGCEIIDNLIVLRECVEEAYRKNEELIVVAIDFRKAFDSVKREALVDLLCEMKIPTGIVDFMVRMYTGETRRMEMGGVEIEMEATSGIKQGCTASTTLFKMVTYKMIEELSRAGCVTVGRVRVASMFYADDGLLLARSTEEAERKIRIVKKVGERYGLKVNEGKSQCMRFNGREQQEEIEGIGLVEQMKYLGVNVCNRKKMFEKQKEAIRKEAKQLSNMTHSVLERSCHRVIVGKSYWKGVALPRVLYAVEVMDMTEEDIRRLQVMENGVLRKMLNAPSYAVVAGLRGEVGIGTMKSRLIRGRLQYVRRKKQGEDSIAARMMEEMIEHGGSSWMKKTVEYMKWIGIGVEEVGLSTGEQLKKKIAQKVEEEWRQELEGKSSMARYRMRKQKMREEDYDGSPESRVWLRARLNCMELKDRERFEGGDGSCVMCDGGKEDLKHFVMDCRKLDRERGVAIELQRPREENEEDVMGRFLYGEERIWRRRWALYGMWKKRREILKRMEE